MGHYGSNEKAAALQYSGPSRKSLRAMVNVVLTSINHLVPKTEESEHNSSNSQDFEQELFQEPAQQCEQEEISPVKLNDKTFDGAEIANVEVPKMDTHSV